MYVYFKRQAGEIVHDKTLAWLRKQNREKESESLLNGDRDGTVSYIINDGSKLAQKEWNTTGKERWSTGNCARNWNLTILPKSI